jgi:hypothetical protein
MAGSKTAEDSGESIGLCCDKGNQNAETKDSPEMLRGNVTEMSQSD